MLRSANEMAMPLVDTGNNKDQFSIDSLSGRMDINRDELSLLVHRKIVSIAPCLNCSMAQFTVDLLHVIETHADITEAVHWIYHLETGFSMRDVTNAIGRK